MTPIDTTVRERLQRAGFRVVDWATIGPEGLLFHRVNAIGLLGQVEVIGRTRDEAFALAMDKANALLRPDNAGADWSDPILTNRREPRPVEYDRDEEPPRLP